MVSLGAIKRKIERLQSTKAKTNIETDPNIQEEIRLLERKIEENLTDIFKFTKANQHENEPSNVQTARVATFQTS